MGNSALITPRVLTWAREQLDMSLGEASEYLKVEPEKLRLWENGSKHPTICQAKNIAKKYKIPYVFFYLPEPPQNIKLPRNQDYRTFANQRSGKFSIALKTLLFDIMQRREALIQLKKELATDIPPFSYFSDIQTADINDIAILIRKAVGLPKSTIFKTDYEAFNYFRAELEKIGILVFQAVNVDLSEMRGVSVYEDTYPIIAVNRNDSPHARVFTLFHELAHLITRTAGICDNRGMSEASNIDIEKTCSRIAARVLVPEDALRESAGYKNLMGIWDDVCVRDIANGFSVSREVILGRLLELNDISFDFYSRKMIQYSDEFYINRQKRKPGGYLPPSTDKETQLGRVYIGTVLTAYNKDVITARDAIQYFEGLKLKHFEKLEQWCFA